MAVPLKSTRRWRAAFIEEPTIVDATDHTVVSVTAIFRELPAKSQRDSRQLQPYVAFGVRLQLRRKRPKNESLNHESRRQTEWPSDQQPTRALFQVAECDRS